jgi:hypothetical protein
MEAAITYCRIFEARASCAFWGGGGEGSLSFGVPRDERIKRFSSAIPLTKVRLFSFIVFPQTDGEPRVSAIPAAKIPGAIISSRRDSWPRVV